MSGASYDRLADAYSAFQDANAAYYRVADDALRRLLGPGEGRCLDVGCGGGRVLALLADLGWAPVGVDESEDQLRVAGERVPGAQLVRADAHALPFADESFDGAVSTFTHTDVENFARAIAEAKRVLRAGARLVYVGNHPCFVGPAQEHTDSGVPVLHPGYRDAGRHMSAFARGATPGGWRTTLGSFIHLPLGEFLAAFSGLTLVAAEELDDGWDYPKTIALAFSKP